MAGKPKNRYDLISRLLHWSIALLFIALFFIGWKMVSLSYYDAWYNRALNWHKSLGILIGLLVCVKLGWYLMANHPAADKTLAQWERWLSKLAHYFLLAAMIVLPISGYLMSSSAGDPIAVFNWFKVSPLSAIGLPAVSTDLRYWAVVLHYYFSYGAIGVIAAHLSGALKHHFIDKKDTLRRML